jgi:uncharacterized protein YciI
VTPTGEKNVRTPPIDAVIGTTTVDVIEDPSAGPVPVLRSGRVAGMYLALMYDLVDDYLDRRPEFRDEHLGLARAAHDRGELALAGALADPSDRALLVWSTEDRSVVEAFVEADPYVQNGLVQSWEIRPWNVVIGG